MITQRAPRSDSTRCAELPGCVVFGAVLLALVAGLAAGQSHAIDALVRKII